MVRLYLNLGTPLLGARTCWYGFAERNDDNENITGVISSMTLTMVATVIA
eukprot:SAG31_NODE_6669_length_1932_cov_4.918712_3_plen_50_part_00